MTTVFDVSLKVAKEAGDVIEGTATGGSTSTLVDTNLLTAQANDYFNKGALWIKSGTHAGKVFFVTDFVQSTGTVTFAAVTGAIAAGVKYAIFRSAYPFDQILSAIQRAMDSTWVTAEDSTMDGDGSTLEFTLPAGVYNVLRIECGVERSPSHHWKETQNGKIRFDYGYAPYNGDTLYVIYRTPHPELTDYSVTINNEINLEWLKYQSAQELLWWGVGMYGTMVEYRIEERMNKVMAQLKGKSPRRSPEIITRTAG